MRLPHPASAGTLRRRSLSSKRLLTLSLLLLLLAGTLLLAATLYGLPGTGRPASAGVAPLLQSAGVPLVVFSEFDHEADILWAADPLQPSRRTELTRVGHAPGYGIYPSLSPDGAYVAFTVLPPSAAVRPDAADAELRLFEIATGTTTRLGGGFDLSIVPVWSPESDTLVVRRSIPGEDGSTVELLRLDLGGAETFLVREAAALYPIQFSPDASRFYYAAYDASGTDLRSVSSRGGDRQLAAHLSEGIARDVSLSPDGTQVAYLAETQSNGSVRYVAQVLELASGDALAPLGNAGVAQFRPVWEPDGALTIGRLDAVTGRGTPLRLSLEGDAEAIPAERTTGFDIPISWSPDGNMLALRSFEGVSLAEPGPSRVVVAAPDGTRHELSRNSDIIIAGWLEVAQ